MVRCCTDVAWVRLPAVEGTIDAHSSGRAGLNKVGDIKAVNEGKYLVFASTVLKCTMKFFNECYWTGVCRSASMLIIQSNFFKAT